MLIDWFTVAAQALNFVILVWLMKRFLYKPILHAIDARERLIATALADASSKQAEAHKERNELQHKHEELDQQRADLLSKAREEASAERKRLLDEAHEAADASRTKRQEALRTEAKNLHRAIQRRTQHEVFAIARQVLTDLATASLEQQLIAVFSHRLRALDGAAKAGLADALTATPDAGVIRSAFDLLADQRAVIQNALNETFSAEVRVRFETAPDLVSGIELVTSGQKLGWSIADYLTCLEQGVDDLLDNKASAEVTALPEPTPMPAARGMTEPATNRAARRVDAETSTAAGPKPEGRSTPQQNTSAAPRWIAASRQAKLP